MLDRKVTKIEWDTESDVVVIEWSDGKREEAILLELTYGPQGTWARLTPADDPTYVICVTQSATMPSETYIVHEVPIIPEQPVVITEPEMIEGSQELPSTQEPTVFA